MRASRSWLSWIYSPEAYQLWDSIANGYWHARRLTFLMGGTFHKLEWLRMVGDMVFLLAGALPITLAALRSVWKRDLFPIK